MSWHIDMNGKINDFNGTRTTIMAAVETARIQHAAADRRLDQLRDLWATPLTTDQEEAARAAGL